MFGMNNTARSGVFLLSPGQMKIRALLLRSSTKNSRAPVIATRFVTSGPEMKSFEEQKLEWEYSQLMYETPKKGMVKQLLEWANPPVFGAAVIVAFRGFAVFQRGGWQELAAFVGLVTIVVSATKYAVDRLSKLDRVPFMLAKLHSGLKSDVKEHVDQQNLSLKTEILEHVDQQNLSLKIEILEHVDQQKTEILEHVDQQKTEILGHVDQQKTEILAAIKESKS